MHINRRLDIINRLKADAEYLEEGNVLYEGITNKNEWEIQDVIRSLEKIIDDYKTEERYNV